jgi:AbiTii-like protein
MSSIILELQAEAMDAETNLGSLLRKSLAVATKLQLTEWIAWCRSELNGYHAGAKIPEYRLIQGEMKMFNPYNGVWMQFVGLGPVNSSCSQSIAEIQDLASSEGMIFQSVPPSAYERMTEIITPPKLVLQKTSLVGILDAVRNTILEWTLKLEADGVLGEGMTFSQQEKKTVMKNETNYHIGTFSGVLGNVSGGNVQIGDYNQIEAQLKAANIPGNERKVQKGSVPTMGSKRGQSPKVEDNAKDAEMIRRGWRYGAEDFVARLLDKLAKAPTEHHRAKERNETEAEKADRIVRDSLTELGWRKSDLHLHRKSDPKKVLVARRLRSETSVSLRWIANRLEMGTWTHVSNLLGRTSVKSED